MLKEVMLETAKITSMSSSGGWTKLGIIPIIQSVYKFWQISSPFLYMFLLSDWPVRNYKILELKFSYIAFTINLKVDIHFLPYLYLFEKWNGPTAFVCLLFIAYK